MCLETGVDFELTEQGTFVQARFKRPKTTDKASQLVDPAQKTAELPPNYRRIVSKNAEKILLFLNQQGKIDSHEAQEILGLSQRRIREIFKELIDARYIKKIGKTKGSFYILNDEGEDER